MRPASGRCPRLDPGGKTESPASAAAAAKAAAAGIADPVPANAKGVYACDRDGYEETDERKSRYIHEEAREKQD